ncbi:hypothetical protein V2O64_18360 [Verrucomicrobiaceae bacterium 227]
MIRLLVLLLISSFVAEGAFYRTQIKNLGGGEIKPEVLTGTYRETIWTQGWGQQSGLPGTRFEEFSFVVATIDDDGDSRGDGELGEAWLIIELDQPREAKGFLDVWDREKSLWQSVACQLDVKKLTACSDVEVQTLRGIHARHQLSVRARGGIWYRSQIEGGDEDRLVDPFEQTFATLSGGRALAENLALDRDLILGNGKDEGEVDLTSIRGVTVKPIPWKERLAKVEISVDALSKQVPEDQYFMVVSSIQELFGLMTRVEEAGTPILQSFQVGDDYRELPSRYRRQLGLDLPDVLARLLPVRSVAVTGGDPFFPTGSDLAVLFETDKVDFVFSSLETAVKAKAVAAGATSVGEGDVVAFANESRSFSCFLGKLEGAVVVANSAEQLRRIQAVAAGKAHALGGTDEYRFFRHRYPVDADESAYVFISDVCLRRWAGPAVRIGASRRNRAMAALGMLTSRAIRGEELSQEFEPLLGKVHRSGEKVFSERYGSMGFLTPVSELAIERVSIREKEAYERWRRGYEGGWSKFFDPIAIRLHLKKEREELDLTILPLRVDSDYREMVNLVGDARLSQAASTVPGEAVFHFAMAIDTESEFFQEANVSLIEILPSLKINPLGWMGSSVSVTLGESLGWQAGANLDILEELPVLLRVEVESRIKLALFMTGVKGAIETSAPDLVSWETRMHAGRRYVAIVDGSDEDELGFSIYYAALPSALLVSLNEDMLKRALEGEGDLENEVKVDEQIFAETSPGFLSQVSEMADGQSLEMRRRSLSWSALPILNEWRKKQSAQDPVAFHEERFTTRITCPGGLGYRWNEKDLTMESVAYGHPGNYRDEAQPLKILEGFKTMETKASFEEGGLRLKLTLDQKSDFKRPLPISAPRPAEDQVVQIQDFKILPVGTILKYRIESGEDVEGYESKVESVTKKEDLLLIESSFQRTQGEQIESGKFVDEYGPRGMRKLSMTGNATLIPDPEAYDFPKELWPGLVFEVRKNESYLRDDVPEKYASAETVTVLGWETIKGPDGGEVEALKLERRRIALAGPGIMRTVTVEWLARGHGLLQSTRTMKWGNSSLHLEKIIRPE